MEQERSGAVSWVRPDEARPGYLYIFVAEHITKRIETGDLPPNTVLPNEQRLAREYGVSLGTARHATRVLRERGLVVTVRSKGTYIAPRQTTKDSR